ncbi:MAG: hypothetical protein ABEK01_05415 [Candidatus Nanohaloarchaea archaeon]
MQEKDYDFESVEDAIEEFHRLGTELLSESEKLRYGGLPVSSDLPAISREMSQVWRKAHAAKKMILKKEKEDMAEQLIRNDVVTGDEASFLPPEGKIAALIEDGEYGEEAGLLWKYNRAKEYAAEASRRIERYREEGPREPGYVQPGEMKTPLQHLSDGLLDMEIEAELEDMGETYPLRK